VRRVAALALLAALVLAGCGGTDRPEGAVERWLNSLNQGAAGRPGRYAPPDVSNRVLRGWEQCDPGALDTTEVGRNGAAGGADDSPYAAFAILPFEVEYASNVADLCPEQQRGTSFGGTVWVVKTGHGPNGNDWRIGNLDEIRHLAPLQPPTTGASASIWAIGLLIGLLLCGLVALLMRAMPRPAPLSSEPLDPGEARGL
jgi:hypothetical protein